MSSDFNQRLQEQARQANLRQQREREERWRRQREEEENRKRAQGQAQAWPEPQQWTTGDPGGLRDLSQQPNLVVGRIYQFSQYYEWDTQTWLVTFRLDERLDGHGTGSTRNAPIQVAMRGTNLQGGALNNQDVVQVRGRWKAGTLWADVITNLHNGAQTRMLLINVGRNMGWVQNFKAIFVAVGVIFVVIVFAIFFVSWLTRAISMGLLP